MSFLAEHYISISVTVMVLVMVFIHGSISGAKGAAQEAISSAPIKSGSDRDRCKFLSQGS